MDNIIAFPMTLYPTQIAADHVAALLVDDEDGGFAYEVVARTDGRFAIEVFDPEGFSCGLL